MKKKYTKQGVRSLIAGFIAIISLPVLIPWGGAVLFPLLTCGTIAVALGTIAFLRYKDRLGLVGIIWGSVALYAALSMIVVLLTS